MSAGCLGSMSKLQVWASVLACDASFRTGGVLPPPVEILKITLSLRLLQRKLEVFVHFWDFLEVIWNLETLHI